MNPLHVVLGFFTFFPAFPAGRPLTGIWKWVLGPRYVAAAGMRLASHGGFARRSPRK